MRLVVELEDQPRMTSLEAPRNLLPKHHEAYVDRRWSNGELAGIESVTIQLPVVMHVQNDHQPLCQQLVDDGLDPLHEGRIDGERRLRAGVIAPAHGQPHRPEACRRYLVDEIISDGEAPR